MIKNFFNKPITKRFIDAFPKFEADAGEDVKYFWETWEESPFLLKDSQNNEILSKDDLKKIYYHLLAKYYNWHFIYMDDLGISLNVMHIIEEYYPNCKERLKIADDLRALTYDEFKKSGLQINSAGGNPKVPTEMDELIELVDSQNASFQLKSIEQTMRSKFQALFDGIMDQFVDLFKPCFVKLYNGVNSYLYKNEVDEEEEEEE